MECVGANSVVTYRNRPLRWLRLASPWPRSSCAITTSWMPCSPPSSSFSGSTSAASSGASPSTASTRSRPRPSKLRPSLISLHPFILSSHLRHCSPLLLSQVFFHHTTGPTDERRTTTTSTLYDSCAVGVIDSATATTPRGAGRASFGGEAREKARSVSRGAAGESERAAPADTNTTSEHTPHTTHNKGAQKSVPCWGCTQRRKLSLIHI